MELHNAIYSESLFSIKPLLKVLIIEGRNLISISIHLTLCLSEEPAVKLIARTIFFYFAGETLNQSTVAWYVSNFM